LGGEEAIARTSHPNMRIAAVLRMSKKALNPKPQADAQEREIDAALHCGPKYGRKTNCLTQTHTLRNCVTAKKYNYRMNSRYSFSPIVSRKAFEWPHHKRLAVYVALNVESYSLGSGLIEELLPAAAQPDVLNYSWCDYGNRVGVWRILDVLKELSIPVTLLINSHVYEHYPEIVDSFRDRGDEIACHGRTNSEQQGGLTEAAERELISEATRTLIDKGGLHPRGWLSPWISETHATPDILKSAGYTYVLDWCCDDQPVWLTTASGPLLAVPYPQEINDSSTVIGRFVTASDFADMIIDQFEEMLLQSEGPALVMGIALHSHISGQPFRLRHLRRALKHISDARGGFWLTRAGAIADHFIHGTSDNQQ
jgi:allantoinase